MLLTRTEAELVFKLHSALMQFVNAQLKIVVNPAVPESAADYSTFSGEKRREVVKAFLGRLDLIHSFTSANPARLAPDELRIVSSWRHLVSGEFIALRQLQKHMLLLSCDDSRIAYGVTGLTDPIETLIPIQLPAMIETVLLPFGDKIVYDGIVCTSRITFGPEFRRGLEEQYRIAKANNAIVTALPWKPQTSASQADSPSPKEKAKRKARQPRVDVQSVLQQVVALTDAFCEKHLTNEYMELCRKLAIKLAAKRPTPLLSGRVQTWAVGILRTIGWVNFLDNRSDPRHMKLTAIDKALGVAESTGQQKAQAIRQMLKIHQWDHRWTLPSRWESTLMIWRFQNSLGVRVDIREESLETQRAAFRKGWIPYVPADRAAAAVQEQIANSASRRLFQFKITLRGVEPAIWRRIQVFDDTLDKLHEHFQNAMGWTNSHLNHFIIQGRRCGDPELLDDGFEPFTGLDSTTTLISAVLPADGAPLEFEYLYDFGDSWLHDVMFEGSPTPQPGMTYPQCLEGERACPPEDVGGIHGFSDYLEVIADPKHERHAELLEWSGPFNPSAFSPSLATHMMQEGMPDWRQMA